VSAATFPSTSYGEAPNQKVTLLVREAGVLKLGKDSWYVAPFIVCGVLAGRMMTWCEEESFDEDWALTRQFAFELGFKSLEQ
jgi:hypothetical protein